MSQFSPSPFAAKFFDQKSWRSRSWNRALHNWGDEGQGIEGISGEISSGGEWINSSEGACRLDPLLTGITTFVSKYQKDANVPTGNTEFQFMVADLDLKSTSYDWLVIAGAKAQHEGTGTINGAGEYGFMLTATDGSPDKFRIKIWDKATDEIIYDNMIGAADDANLETAIEGSSIVIHKVK